MSRLSDGERACVDRLELDQKFTLCNRQSPEYNADIAALCALVRRLGAEGLPLRFVESTAIPSGEVHIHSRTDCVRIILGESDGR